MSNLSKLTGKAKKVKIGGTEIELEPLRTSDMDLIHNFGEVEGKEQIEIVKKIIQKSIPGSTMEEVNNMSVEYMTKLQDEIMEINNLNPDKEKKAFEDKIRDKQK